MLSLIAHISLSFPTTFPNGLITMMSWGMSPLPLAMMPSLSSRPAVLAHPLWHLWIQKMPMSILYHPPFKKPSFSLPHPSGPSFEIQQVIPTKHKVLYKARRRRRCAPCAPCRTTPRLIPTSVRSTPMQTENVDTSPTRRSFYRAHHLCLCGPVLKRPLPLSITRLSTGPLSQHRELHLGTAPGLLPLYLHLLRCRGR
ncbi:hypothetical protein BJV78DRAFT_945923 [Lactifluus subvellereus]|nr:hypothetical protein BJV78DRAFT_945923 [Lactifluus subvellereus]